MRPWPAALTLVVSLAAGTHPARAASLFAQTSPGLVSKQAPVGTIAGRIVDAQATTGIAGVRIRLTPRDGQAPRPPSFDAVTTSDGAFTIAGVLPGRYRLVVALDGFLPLEYRDDIVVVDGGELTPLLVAYPLRMTTEVEATAETRATLGAPAGSTMGALSGHEIVMAPGSLDDVMRAYHSRPGVAASQDDRNDLLVRGGGAIENAVRIDGFDIANPSHFGAQGGTGGGFAIIAPWLIERAVLRAGGFSVDLGEHASSVLDLSLKGGAHDGVHGQAGAGVGGILGEAGGPVGRSGGSWLVSIRRSFVQYAIDRGDGEAVPTFGDGVARLDVPVSSRHRFEILGVGGIDNVSYESSDGFDKLNDDQTASLLGVSLRSLWSPKTTTALFVSWGRWTIDAVDLGRGKTDGSDRSTEIEWRARGEVRHRVGRDGELMAGAALKHADLSFDLEAKSFRNDYNVMVPALHSHFPFSLTDGAAYAEAKLPTVGRIQVTPGVRVDRAATTGRSFVSPRLNAEFALTDAVRLTGAWGVYRQTVPYIWIGSNVDNAKLDPIKSVQLLGGISWRVARTRFSIEAFDKRYEGYPVEGDEPWHVLVDASTDYDSPFVGLLSPTGRLRAHGVDMSMGRTFGGRLGVDAAYSYWRVTQAGTDGIWRAADYDIRHQVKLSVGYEVARKWRAAADFRYASGRPYTPFDQKLSIKNGWGYHDRMLLNAVNYDAYHRLDVRFDRTFTIRGTSLAVFAEVQNLYDRNNLYFYDWSRSRKQATPVYQWGRQPMGGVRWEF